MYAVPAYVWALVLIGAIGIPATTSVMLYRGALAAGLGRRTATAVTATAAGIGIGYLAGLGPYRPLDITPSTEPLSLLPLALVATVAVPTVIALTSSRSAVCAPATGPSRTEPTTPSQPAAEPPCGGGPASFTTAADTWLTGAQPRQFAREELDMESNWEDAPRTSPGVPMRYKVGAEQLERVPSLAHRPDGVFRVARTAPVGPTHAVCAQTGATACGIKAEALAVLDEDWEAACFVEKCSACFAALAGGS